MTSIWDDFDVQATAIMALLARPNMQVAIVPVYRAAVEGEESGLWTQAIIVACQCRWRLAIVADTDARAEVATIELAQEHFEACPRQRKKKT